MIVLLSLLFALLRNYDLLGRLGLGFSLDGALLSATFLSGLALSLLLVLHHADSLIVEVAADAR